MPYASLTDLKTHAGIPAAGADTLLQALLDSATQWIDGYTNSTFAATTVSGEKHDGRGARHVLLRQRPVSSIDSVSLDGTLLDTAQYALVDSAWLVAPEHCGYCPRLGYTDAGGCSHAVWPRGTQNIAVDYTCGYSAVPAAVAQACALLAAHWYRTDQRQLASASSPASGRWGRARRARSLSTWP